MNRPNTKLNSVTRERAVSETITGACALEAGELVVARRVLSDTRVEFLIMDGARVAHRGPMTEADVRACIDASRDAGETVQLVPLERVRGGRRLARERARIVRA